MNPAATVDAAADAPRRVSTEVNDSTPRNYSRQIQIDDDEQEHTVFALDDSSTDDNSDNNGNTTKSTTTHANAGNTCDLYNDDDDSDDDDSNEEDDPGAIKAALLGTSSTPPTPNATTAPSRLAKRMSEIVYSPIPTSKRRRAFFSGPERQNRFAPFYDCDDDGDDDKHDDSIQPDATSSLSSKHVKRHARPSNERNSNTNQQKGNQDVIVLDFDDDEQSNHATKSSADSPQTTRMKPPSMRKNDGNHHNSNQEVIDLDPDDNDGSDNSRRHPQSVQPDTSSSSEQVKQIPVPNETSSSNTYKQGNSEIIIVDSDDDDDNTDSNRKQRSLIACKGKGNLDDPWEIASSDSEPEKESEPTTTTVAVVKTAAAAAAFPTNRLKSYNLAFIAAKSTSVKPTATVLQLRNNLSQQRSHQGESILKRKMNSSSPPLNSAQQDSLKRSSLARMAANRSPLGRAARVLLKDASPKTAARTGKNLSSLVIQPARRFLHQRQDHHRDQHTTASSRNNSLSHLKDVDKDDKDHNMPTHRQSILPWKSCSDEEKAVKPTSPDERKNPSTFTEHSTLVSRIPMFRKVSSDIETNKRQQSPMTTTELTPPTFKNAIDILVPGPKIVDMPLNDDNDVTQVASEHEVLPLNDDNDVAQVASEHEVCDNNDDDEQVATENAVSRNDDGDEQVASEDEVCISNSCSTSNMNERLGADSLPNTSLETFVAGDDFEINEGEVDHGVPCHGDDDDVSFSAAEARTAVPAGDEDVVDEGAQTQGCAQRDLDVIDRHNITVNTEGIRGWSLHQEGSVGKTSFKSPKAAVVTGSEGPASEERLAFDADDDDDDDKELVDDHESDRYSDAETVAFDPPDCEELNDFTADAAAHSDERDCDNGAMTTPRNHEQSTVGTICNPTFESPKLRCHDEFSNGVSAVAGDSASDVKDRSNIDEKAADNDERAPNQMIESDCAANVSSNVLSIDEFDLDRGEIFRGSFIGGQTVCCPESPCSGFLDPMSPQESQETPSVYCHENIEDVPPLANSCRQLHDHSDTIEKSDQASLQTNEDTAGGFTSHTASAVMNQISIESSLGFPAEVSKVPFASLDVAPQASSTTDGAVCKSSSISTDTRTVLPLCLDVKEDWSTIERKEAPLSNLSDTIAKKSVAVEMESSAVIALPERGNRYETSTPAKQIISRSDDLTCGSNNVLNSNAEGRTSTSPVAKHGWSPLLAPPRFGNEISESRAAHVGDKPRTPLSTRFDSDNISNVEDVTARRRRRRKQSHVRQRLYYESDSSSPASKSSATSPSSGADSGSLDSDNDLTAMNTVDHLCRVTWERDTGLPIYHITAFSVDEKLFQFRFDVKESSIPNAGYGSFVKFLGALVLKPEARRRADDAMRERNAYIPDTLQPLTAESPEGFGIALKLTGSNLHGNGNNIYWPKHLLSKSTQCKEKIASNGEDDNIKKAPGIGFLGMHTLDDYEEDPEQKFCSRYKGLGLIDLGRYGPFRKEDRKQKVDFDLKSFIFGHVPSEWCFGVEERLHGHEQIIDITDDDTGEPHQLAKAAIPMYVNEVGHNPRLKQNVFATERDERTVEYCLKLSDSLAKGDSVELLVDYFEVYELVRERKGYGKGNLTGKVKSDEHHASALQRNFVEREAIEEMVNSLSVKEIFYALEFVATRICSPIVALTEAYLEGVRVTQPTNLQWLARRRLHWLSGVFMKQLLALERCFTTERRNMHVGELTYPYVSMMEKCKSWLAEMKWPDKSIRKFLVEWQKDEGRDDTTPNSFSMEVYEEVLFNMRKRLVEPFSESVWCPLARKLFARLCRVVASVSWTESDQVVANACLRGSLLSIGKKFINEVIVACDNAENGLLELTPSNVGWLSSPVLQSGKGITARNIISPYVIASPEADDGLEWVPIQGPHGTPRSLNKEWYLLWQVLYIVDVFASEYLPRSSDGLLEVLCTHAKLKPSALETARKNGLSEIYGAPRPKKVRSSTNAASNPKRSEGGAKLDKVKKEKPRKSPDGVPKPRVNNFLFFKIVWACLTNLGWTLETGNRPTDYYFLPPGTRRGKGFRNRTDYFDSCLLVLDFIRNDGRWRGNEEVKASLDCLTKCSDLLDDLRKRRKLPKGELKLEWLLKQLEEQQQRESP